MNVGKPAPHSWTCVNNVLPGQPPEQKVRTAKRTKRMPLSLNTTCTPCSCCCRHAISWVLEILPTSMQAPQITPAHLLPIPGRPQGRLVQLKAACLRRIAQRLRPKMPLGAAPPLDAPSYINWTGESANPDIPRAPPAKLGQNVAVNDFLWPILRDGRFKEAGLGQPTVGVIRARKPTLRHTQVEAHSLDAALESDPEDGELQALSLSFVPVNPGPQILLSWVVCFFFVCTCAGSLGNVGTNPLPKGRAAG